MSEKQSAKAYTTGWWECPRCSSENAYHYGVTAQHCCDCGAVVDVEPPDPPRYRFVETAGRVAVMDTKDPGRSVYACYVEEMAEESRRAIVDALRLECARLNGQLEGEEDA